ncbi:MAG: hypothetical protein Q4A90_01680 [Streptococcus sp.]|nr:hypothetical protein [Streptococcus sp.]
MSDIERIQNTISAIESKISAVKAELDKLEAAKKEVKGVVTSIKYKVSPKEYHLEGQKYSDLEKAEKDILDDLKGDMKSKKDVVIEQLDMKIASKQSYIYSLNSHVRVLSSELTNSV